MTVVGRRFTKMSLAIGLAVPMAGMQAVAVAAPSIQDSLIAIEDARFKAQVDRDIPALDKAIAADAVYIHANGIRQTKAQYLHDVEVGASRYRGIEASEREVNIDGKVAVTHALVTLHVGTDRTILARTTGIYVKRTGKWLVQSWQSTPVTAAPPASSPPR